LEYKEQAMDSSIWGIISIVVLACGLYGLHGFTVLKKGGMPNLSMLMGQEYEKAKPEVREEFLQKSAPILLLFSLACTVYGIVDFVHCYVYSIPIADTAAGILFFVILLVFVIFTSKMRRKYFDKV